jgi:hypothetical protein
MSSHEESFMKSMIAAAAVLVGSLALPFSAEAHSPGWRHDHYARAPLHYAPQFRHYGHWHKKTCKHKHRRHRTWAYDDHGHHDWRAHGERFSGDRHRAYDRRWHQRD